MDFADLQFPKDLKTLSLERLKELAEDLRQKILSTCLKNGGHLGASLGTVELAIALLRTFDSPSEPIIWDVGHQAYAHKLLTGRWKEFHTLRSTGGISGFLSREENSHDVYGAGHSSTSLSAALAMAWTSPAWTVAVIGDGGLTAGVALEALNHLSALRTGPLLVVLNDNQMSISANVGAIPSILASGQAGEFFSHFGFDYLGPLDGHDLGQLIGTLQALREGTPEKPILLHVHTQKGKGYIPAEEHPAAYHGISPVQSKIPDQQAPTPKRTYSDAFGEALCKLAQSDPRVVAITAAMPEGTGLSEFARRFPDRFFDVGIAEPHAVTFAAGLATRGYRPVVAIYSTFLQRALDPIIHDVALQNLGVIFAIDRAGLVGADGPTHHGAFDLSYLGMIPNLELKSPSCLGDMKQLLAAALASSGPVAIRYPRGGGPATLSVEPENDLRWVRGPQNARAVLVGFGQVYGRVEAASRTLEQEGFTVAAAVSLSAKPFPKALLAFLEQNPRIPLITLEEGVVRGGFGQSLAASVPNREGKLLCLGYGDHFVPHGAPADLERLENLSEKNVIDRVRTLLKSEDAAR